MAYDDIDQLRRDRDEWKDVAERRMQERDELAEALEWMLRAYADSDDCEAIRETLARVKGR